MAPVSRDVVIAAVKEYGEAWMTQDPIRIGELFTTDAVYVERAFDRKATFRGRNAIEQYWEYQICGKQSNISFRHVESEMVRDADQPMAVVKWLAEFTTRLEKRGNKTTKTVRFCQMAKLIFDNNDDKNNNKIRYLEEYAQSMTGPGVRWPNGMLQASDEELWKRIRFDPIDDISSSKTSIACSNCNLLFASRTKLFAHLNSTELVGDKCIPIQIKAEKESHVLICLSISYCGLSSSKDPEHYLRQAGRQIWNADPQDDYTIPITWAVPTEFCTSAIVNIATMKLPEIISKNSTVPVNDLPEKLNEILNALIPREDGSMVTVHTAGLVSSPCTHERREFEKYMILIPWKLLQSTNKDSASVNSLLKSNEKRETFEKVEKISQPSGINTQTNDDSPVNIRSNTNNKPWRRPTERRRPIEETKAFQFMDATVARRMKHACRIMKDFGKSNVQPFDNENKLRMRSSTMEEPYHSFCEITISMRASSMDSIERILALLIAYTRNDICDDESFVQMLQQKSSKGEASDQPKPPSMIFPSQCLILVEPAITRYESKMKVCLCRNNLRTTDMVKTSIDKAETIILDEMAKTVSSLQDWIDHYLAVKC